MDWKGHTLLGFLFGIPFVHDFASLCVVIAGALFPDLDHEKKEDILIKNILFLSFIIIFLSVLYYFKRSIFDFSIFISCVLLFVILVSINFLNHRGLTHSIFLAILISLILGFVVFKLAEVSLIFAGALVLYLLTKDYAFSKIIIFSIFIETLFKLLNLEPFIELKTFGFLKYSFLFFIGYFSHIIGDSITPQGVKIFQPFSEHKLNRSIVFFLIFLYVILLFILILNKIKVIQV